ncbi:MAG: recombinase family protein [Anaerolineae bacterium]|nr:recombinase family protein [Anaerolineae bacterium]
MIKAISYVRVSTVEQASEGISLAAQQDAIRAYARFKNMELVHELTDAGVSAGKPLQERDGGRRLFQYAGYPHIRAVIAFKLDRLFRDAADCLAVTRIWDELEVDLHLVDLGGQPVDTSTAMGRFFLTIMAGVAEMERNLIRERTKAAMAHLKSLGKRVGSIPYGYKLAPDGRTLLKEPQEQRVIANARALRREGLSLRKISAALQAKGMRSRNGRPFQATQIKRMLE